MSESHQLDPVLHRLAAELRRPVATDPHAKTRVMDGVRELPPVRRPSALRWFLRPRQIMISPLAGLAVAAGLALVMVLADREGDAPAQVAEVPVTTAAARHVSGTGPSTVEFVLVASAASSVSLVGSFNDWNATATPLRPTGTPGVWSVSVPLTPGRHVYAFVVDGSQWIADPTAPQAPDDDFGSPNSVIMIGESST